MKAPPLKHSRSTGRITLADVAAKAQVSPITASRALRSSNLVSAELAKRVALAAQQLGYVADSAARTLASARSSNIVVLVPLLTNALFVEILEAIHSVVMPTGFQTLIGVTHYDSVQEEALIRVYLANRPAGFIVTGFDRTEAARRLLANSQLPCVHMMEVSSAPDVYSVGFSQSEAGFDLTQHLIARGRKNIAFAAAQLDPRTLQRAEGYRKAMRAAGLYNPSFEVLNPQKSSMRLGAELLKQAMQQVSGLDAIFFNNDDLAQGALLMAQRLGVSVPKQIAIAGFNNLTGSDQMNPALTSIQTPLANIGKEAAQMMLQLLRHEPVPQPSLDLGYQLLVREST
jgi:LacI family transcriptional regulator, gluconate utilization system Gnt-I transcriptional repressor